MATFDKELADYVELILEGYKLQPLTWEMNSSNFFFPYVNTTKDEQARKIRCPGCGGELTLSGEYIASLPEDSTERIKMKCKYECIVRVKQIKERTK